MRGDKHPETPVAESTVEETPATAAGIVIGEVDGLLWEDTSGVDIVSVTIVTGQVAVPVDRGRWRSGGIVELGYEVTQVEQAPSLNHLRDLSLRQTVEQVAEYYAVALGGPPPGPDPQPLPPWWIAEDERD
ncbi:hypothetical protein C6I20_11555 [Aeromicrobium sp. A1-2]|uniref:hypothetical protein n=1 Tax=Aeromicrobium sp. A1-2 TaxID=2107713 RepID=UPI000E488E5E|nr:hypothetical protein [Aeromicrobium sp. A1-2]AXT85760.1 hypothetical protein C6I20_11555 [Aeromicrobium sp. A1-2]